MSTKSTKRLIKVKLGQSVPLDAVLIKTEKVKENINYNPPCGCPSLAPCWCMEYDLVEYAYYEVCNFEREN